MPVRHVAAARTQPVVIAIPAKDEAERIGACLTAIDKQTRRPDIVLLLLNNCVDSTATVARAQAPQLGYRLECDCRTLPPPYATAGYARRLAMALAAELAGPNGILLTTDADTTPPPDWLARNLAAIRNGADVVCGRALINPKEARLIPDHLHLDDALERELAGLLDSIAWTLDPEINDPPPRHTEASGATLAMTVKTFHRVGGVPAIPCGEDRALVRAAWMRDARVRHDPSINVTVSGRVAGRASGGMAETIRRRMIRQDEFTDDQLEPAHNAWARYALRRRVRWSWAGSSDPTLARDLAIAPERLLAALRRPFFGAAWAALEGISPRLARHRVRFADLPAEIAIARTLLPADALAAD